MAFVSFLQIYGPIIPVGAILISATIAGVIALSGIRTNRELSRKMATLRLIQDAEEKEHYTLLQEHFWQTIPVLSQINIFFFELPV